VKTAGARAPLPPDLERWREGGSGVDHVVLREGPRPGPTAMLVALIHGNEICGALALDRLLGAGLAPTRGRLFCCFANLAAYRRADPVRPEAGRFIDEDMNRLWSPARLGSAEASLELARAKALRPFADAADWLLDLHSMREGETPLALCGVTSKGLSLARRVGYPATVVTDRGHRGGVRLVDYGDFGRAASEKAALLVECGSHFGAGSGAVALEAALRFLLTLDMVDRGFAAELVSLAPPPAQRIIEVTEVVTIASRAFRFARPLRNMECVAEPGTLIAREGKREFRTPYENCVLVMPAQGLQPGLTAIRLGRLLEGPPA
jgi:predicted deacylase